MKTKAQKYQEAVARNISNLGKPKYKNSTMDVCRMMLGIRKGDESWDHLIFKQRMPSA